MDDQLSKVLEDFCKIRSDLNTSNVTGKTVSIITRFVKAVQIAEKIVSNPPKRDTSYDPELHLKTSTYAPLKKVEPEWAKPEKVTAQINVEGFFTKEGSVPTEKVKVPKKRGPKPKK